MDITIYCQECKNFFLKNGVNDIHRGTFVIENHTITPLDFLIPEQYFYISGSKLNDRVICNNAADLSLLRDETFTGAIWDMSVTPAFIELCGDVNAWREKNDNPESAAMSPFSSESFGGYSYSKGGGSSSTGGAATVWQDVFRPRFNAFRRINII